jgi:hypothetical protein
MHLRGLATILIFSLASLNPSFAHPQEDVAACTPDALRLCQAAIPDEGRVTQCLAQHKKELSPACAEVFNRPINTNAKASPPEQKPISAPVPGELDASRTR